MNIYSNKNRNSQTQYFTMKYNKHLSAEQKHKYITNSPPQ